MNRSRFDIDPNLFEGGTVHVYPKQTARLKNSELANEFGAEAYMKRLHRCPVLTYMTDRVDDE